METILLFIVPWFFPPWIAESAFLPPVPCAPGWFGYKESQACYKPYHNIHLKWVNARKFCWKQGGDLAVTKDTKTYTFVTALLSPSKSYWIGMKSNDDRLMTWIDGETPDMNVFGNLTLDLIGTISCTYLEMGVTTFETITTSCDKIGAFVCQTAPTMCPRKWTGYTNHLGFAFCIKVYGDDRKSWDDAKQQCHSDKGHLVTLRSQAITDFVSGLLHSTNGYWIESVNPHSADIAHLELQHNAPNDDTCKLLQNYDYTGYRVHNTQCEETYPYVCQRDPDIVCQDGWTKHKEKCYKYSLLETTWDEAKKLCRAEGANLLIIPDQDVFNFINGFLGKEEKIYFIGLRRPNARKPFQWVDGSPLGNFQKWKAGEPNLPKVEFCVVMERVHSEFLWNDVICIKEFRFICQKTADITACPKGWTDSQSRQKCYRYYRADYRKWHDASQVCKRQEGHLLTVDNTEDYRFVVEHTSSGPDSSWIGARKDESGQFVWDKKSKPIGRRQNRSLYQEEDGGGGDCAYLFHDQDNNKGYLSKSTSCDDTKSYICQKDDVLHPGVFTCPPGYTASNTGRSCFKVIFSYSLKSSWTEARDYCYRDGGDLAIIPDMDTDNFIAGLLTLPYNYWFGLAREAKSDDFKWVDSTPESSKSDSWMPSEPTHYFNELCVGYRHSHYYYSYNVFKTTRYYYWNDFPCIEKLRFVCDVHGHGLSNLKEVGIDGRSHHISYGRLPFSDVEDVCQLYNLTQLFIQSNDHFKQVQAWVSNTSFLQGDDIWIRTNKPLFWDFNTWNNNEFISPEAWVSNIQNRTCSHEEECCVVLTKDANRPGHYLANTKCSEDALYLCVKENQLNSTTIIAPPELEQNNVRSLAKLKELTTSKSNQNNKCPCRCGMNFNNFNVTTQFMDEIREKIVKELVVKTDTLSATVNKKKSAKDSRPSSQTFGYAAILLISIPVILIVVFDLTRFCQQRTVQPG